MRRLSTREKSGPPQYLPGVPLNPSSSGKYAVKGHPGAQQPIAAQPQIVYVQGPEVISEKEAPDHLIMSILVTIFCCLPFGIAGMLKASDCRNARMRGDRKKRAAVRSSGQEVRHDRPRNRDCPHHRCSGSL